MEFIANQLRSFKQCLSARLRLPVEASNINSENGSVSFVLIISYCLASAVAISLEFWQLSAQPDHDNHLQKMQTPPSLLLLSAVLIIAFAATFAAKIISLRRPNSPHAKFLERVGILFVAISFFIAITAPFPRNLQFISWIIFFASFLAIIIYVLLYPAADA